MSRSYLFVPGDSERKLEKSVASGADALIVDLEDSVAGEAKTQARGLAREFVAAGDHAEVWVRINPLSSAEADADLAAVIPAAPAGVVLPKPQGAADVRALAAMLDRCEEQNGLQQGSTAILPICTETPQALFRLHEYADEVPRLAAMTWGAEDLSAAIGASAKRAADGSWLPPYELARSLCLFAASAAAVAAVDTVFTDFADADGLARYAANARRDGFEGMLAIHPAQVSVINAAFDPTDEEIARAQRIVDLFAASPASGALALDGEMVDRPHLLQAERLLTTARRVGKTQ